MAEQESSKVRELSESPLRAFAREAITARRAPAEILGASIWRIAEYIRQQLQESAGQPVTPLEHATPRDRTLFLTIARGTLRQIAALQTIAPPTVRELQQQTSDTALVLARSRIRCRVLVHRHRLSQWRPDLDRPGIETAICVDCGAGASLRVDDAVASVSDPLLQPCPLNHVLFEQEIRR